MGRFHAVVRLLALFGAPLFAAAFLLGKDDIATIVDSGSTNTVGFRIVVQRSGKAEWITTSRRYGSQAGEGSKTKQQQLSHALIDRLFSDLNAVRPLSSIPKQGCMKSASFGTTRAIEFDGQRTPDLTCGGGGNAKVQALIQDVNEIVELFPTKQSGPMRLEHIPKVR